jgi:hypothetical protein
LVEGSKEVTLVGWVRAEGVDTVDITVYESGEYTGWMGRVGRYVEVKV